MKTVLIQITGDPAIDPRAQEGMRVAEGLSASGQLEVGCQHLLTQTEEELSKAYDVVIRF